jgi:hypothetical protein
MLEVAGLNLETSMLSCMSLLVYNGIYALISDFLNLVNL